ncbi:zinc finger and SCAN domain-containing protein 12-like [Anastrepha ludens]|uniref:zinc finger and SCAN domain-containing protein 12-like n=1 Tax=Anastrepha ludens TaxID=28586 RepID=UPI0023B0363A|nr:zinc finger and SCAN domain-containing protein 12-like [Anastrepha ludens]
MELKPVDTKPAVETIFVPGCPNIKTQVSDRKTVKQQIFVANLPVITEPDIAPKTERSSDNDCEQQNTELLSQDNSTSSCEDFEEELNKNPIRITNKANENPKKRKRASEKVLIDPKFVCKICSMGFQRASNYTIHMKKKHKIVGVATPYSCPNCPRKYEFEYELKRHMQKYRPLEERLIFPCSHCDRKFQTRVHVARHIKFVHENIRPFICEECGEAVHTRTTLREHMLTHTDYSPFECKECGKCFKQKQRLKRHMDIHGEKHICTKCGKQLSSKCTLNKHLLVHSEGKPHKCKYCGRAFKLTKTLKVHLNTHTGDKVYACDFCDKTFSAPSSRRQHKKKKHPEKLLELEALAAENVEIKDAPSLDTLQALCVPKMTVNSPVNKLPESLNDCFYIENVKMLIDVD